MATSVAATPSKGLIWFTTPVVVVGLVLIAHTLAQLPGAELRPWIDARDDGLPLGAAQMQQRLSAEMLDEDEAMLVAALGARYLSTAPERVGRREC